MNDPNRVKHTFWHGAILLTLAGIITKLLSAVYRVPYQNIAGDIGFYIYQQVYPFLGIAVALSIYGFPVMISKMIAETDDKKVKDEVPSIVLLGFMTIFIFCATIFVLLYGFADSIAKLMGDEKLKTPIQMASLPFMIIPFISVLRGFFQGHENMQPTAISQIAEQFIRVGTILVVAYVLVSNGFDPYEVGSGAVLGSATGGFAAIAALLFFRTRMGPNLYVRAFSSFSLSKIRSFPFKKLILNSVTICMTGLTLVLIQLVDAFTLYSLLVKSGMDEQLAKEVKGVFDRGQPLIQLGVVLATSLSLSIVPAVAKVVMQNNHSSLLKHSKLALKVNLIISIGATSGLIAIMKYTNVMLFMDGKGTKELSILALSILFLSISFTHAAILQGLGHIKYPALSVLLGVVLKWVLNVSLIPIMGTKGAAIATVLSVVFVALMNSRVLYLKLNNHRTMSSSIYIKAISAGVFMYLVIKGYEFIFFHLIEDQESRLFGSIYALSSVLIGAIVYFMFILTMKVFDKEEFVQLSIGKKEK